MASPRALLNRIDKGEIGITLGEGMLGESVDCCLVTRRNMISIRMSASFLGFARERERERELLHGFGEKIRDAGDSIRLEFNVWHLQKMCASAVYLDFTTWDNYIIYQYPYSIHAWICFFSIGYGYLMDHVRYNFWYRYHASKVWLSIAMIFHIIVCNIDLPSMVIFHVAMRNSNFSWHRCWMIIYQ